jgi:hypothetical protein
MRRAAVLLVLAACDFRPAPPKPAPNQAAPVAEAVDAAAPAPPPGGDGCLELGAHVGELWVATATDAAEKALYEQERTKTVKRMSDTCTRDAWSDVARSCYLKAQKWLDLEACAALIKAPH